MPATSQEYPQVLLTSPHKVNKPPAWIPAVFSPEVVPAEKIGRLRELSPITVVRVHGVSSMLENEALLTQIAERLASTPGPAKVVFVFDARSSAEDPEGLSRVLTFFERASDVEFVRGVKEAGFALSEALAKIWAGSKAEAEGSADPLGQLEGVLAATRDLRAPSGRLAADRIAAAFGISLNALASAIGTTRQALFKTPDSAAVQSKLGPFERIARLRAVLAPEDFLAWLNLSSELLDDLSPIDLVKRGEAAVVADLAEDMLTGSPA